MTGNVFNVKFVDIGIFFPIHLLAYTFIRLFLPVHIVADSDVPTLNGFAIFLRRFCVMGLTYMLF